MTRYGMAIDQERCLGCHACAMACKMENHIEEGSWMTVETETGSRDTARGQYPDLEMRYVPRTCMHCADPSCAGVCPVGAIHKAADGIVTIESDVCTGCRACIESCPYGAISFDRTRAVAAKCHFCSHRVRRGMLPFCSVCCEGEAIHFGDLDDPGSDVSRFLRTRKAVPLLPEKGTRPSVFYAPPAPRRLL